jgi:hypothetical protein
MAIEQAFAAMGHFSNGAFQQLKLIESLVLAAAPWIRIICIQKDLIYISRLFTMNTKQ